jgi:hypothetical protein
VVRLISFFVLFAWFASAAVAATQSAAYFNEQGSHSAVDAYGRTHRASDYPGGRPPWATSPVKMVAPDYPYSDRRQRREGAGVFQLTLDLKTGAVARITTRQWRWPPGKWKEIIIPVVFTLRPNAYPLAPGAKRLPSRY